MNFDNLSKGNASVDIIEFSGARYAINVKSDESDLSLLKGILGSVGLEKSVIDELGGRYVSDPDKAIITITKTGADIKSKLSVVESKINDSIAKLKAEQLIAIEGQQIPEDCKKSAIDSGDYAFRGVGHRVAESVEVYDDDYVWGSKSREASGSVVQVEYGEHKRSELAQALGKYNSIARDIARHYAELVFLNTIRDNINDSQKIKLTPSQAAVVGF